MDVDSISRWAEMLTAMAHPTRLIILAELLSGMRCVKEIREMLDVPQPNASRHLKELRNSGLVSFFQDGPRRCYYLPKPDLVKDMLALLKRNYPTITEAKQKGTTLSRQYAGEGQEQET